MASPTFILEMAEVPTHLMPMFCIVACAKWRHFFLSSSVSP
eukprot:CAMPEP_0197919574 /NCGR_PEP_ID=MMETSP1439-20131203/87437_1 /TAXON_ID=66791 /ORGANISM="Gonyaulax spinifera, Strain CCMP409" /LENGTH=40 /DNA_ID= /DNA_START= /DNA_END= /DNA_ORIENTATION=